MGDAVTAIAGDTTADSTRRVRYRLPSGDTVALRFDQDEVVPPTTTYQLANGDVVTAKRIVEPCMAKTAGAQPGQTMQCRFAYGHSGRCWARRGVWFASSQAEKDGES